MSGWTKIDGEDYFVVDELSVEGMYSRYQGGSGQNLAVNMSDLRETLSTGEISNQLESRVAGMGLVFAA